MAARVLIVDDSAPVRRLVKTYLEAHPGLAVIDEAADGVEGVVKARALKPDVVILDLAMPRMNGWQAAAALRKLMPQLPIIMFTMHAGALPPSAVHDAGIAAVVSKTGPMEALLAEVRRLTGGPELLSKPATSGASG